MVEKRFVEEAVVAKKLVVVAEVPVALTKVKFWRVEEPVRRRFERVVRPPVAVRVPVKLAADEMVWELYVPPVIAPEAAIVVTPEIAPVALISQTFESMETLSPLSPIVTTPLASKVPLAVRVPERVAAAAVTVPVKVGEAESTRFVVPVEPEISAI